MMQDKLKDKLRTGLNFVIATAQDGFEKLRCTIGIHRDIEENYFVAEVQGEKIRITEVESLICSRCKRKAIVKSNTHEIPLPVKAEEGVIVNEVTTKKRGRKQNADSDI